MKISELLAQAVDQAPDAVLLFDGEGRILSANSRVWPVTGYLNEELIGKEISEVVVDLAPGSPVPTAPGDPGEGRTLTVARKDGSTVQAEAWLASIQSAEKTFTLLVLHDGASRLEHAHLVADARRLEALGGLSATLAHELKAPLAFVVQNVSFSLQVAEKLERDLEALASRVESAVEHPGALAAAQAQIQSMRVYIADGPRSVRAMTEALRDANAGSSQVAELARTIRFFAHPQLGAAGKVDLNDAARAAALLARGEWQYCAIMQLKLAAPIPFATGTQSALTQVAINLIVNSAQAIAARAPGPSGTVEPGHITVCTRAVGGEVELSVQDDGVGIPLAQQGRVFQPHYTTKAAGQGTGLGLCVVKKIVEDDFKGSVQFSSQLGRGATFTVRLPAA